MNKEELKIKLTEVFGCPQLWAIKEDGSIDFSTNEFGRVRIATFGNNGEWMRGHPDQLYSISRSSSITDRVLAFRISIFMVF